MRKVITITLLATMYIADSQATQCNSIPEKLVERLSHGKVLFFGEYHGTKQFPQSFYDVICNARELNLNVVVALEAKTELTGFYQDFINSIDSISRTKRELLLALDDWNYDLKNQDGRRSIAMFNLLENLRKLNLKKKNVVLFGFDAPVNDLSQRDLKMAEKILMKVSSESIVLAFSGNIHSMVEHGVPWDAEKGNAAAFVKEKHSNTESIRLLHSGGTSWSCKGKDSCRVRDIESSSLHMKSDEHFKKSDGADNHDWHWNVGKIEASPPAITLSDER